MAEFRLSDRNKIEILSGKELFEAHLPTYTKFQYKTLDDARKGIISKEDLMQDILRSIREIYITNEEMEKDALKRFDDHFFGYGIITDLLKDPTISDIKIINGQNIRIKRDGIRQSCDVKFDSDKDFDFFIDMVATKNKVNISDLNAIQKFVDNKTIPGFILRFTIITKILNTYETHTISIRKVAYNFPEMDDLVKANMMDEDTKNLLIERFSAGSTLICGGNSSGKTTILNALKETIPEDRSVLVIQQADELTTKTHPDMTFLHSLPGASESEADYGLKQISIAGLTFDIDMFIIGEIKGDEAVYFLNAAYTGQICAGTIHAPSAEKSVDKLIDYCLESNKYSKQELLKMMDCFKTIIFMKGYKVNEVYAITGYNNTTKDLDYLKLYSREESADDVGENKTNN